MNKSKLFQYAILWHPTEKQVKEEGLKCKILVDVTCILAIDEKTAVMAASMKIPLEYQEQLDQVQIVVRPF